MPHSPEKMNTGAAKRVRKTGKETEEILQGGTREELTPSQSTIARRMEHYIRNIREGDNMNYDASVGNQFALIYSKCMFEKNDQDGIMLIMKAYDRLQPYFPEYQELYNDLMRLFISVYENSIVEWKNRENNRAEYKVESNVLDTFKVLLDFNPDNLVNPDNLALARWRHTYSKNPHNNDNKQTSENQKYIDKSDFPTIMHLTIASGSRAPDVLRNLVQDPYQFNSIDLKNPKYVEGLSMLGENMVSYTSMVPQVELFNSLPEKKILPISIKIKKVCETHNIKERSSSLFTYLLGFKNVTAISKVLGKLQSLTFDCPEDAQVFFRRGLEFLSYYPPHEYSELIDRMMTLVTEKPELLSWGIQEFTPYMQKWKEDQNTKIFDHLYDFLEKTVISSKEQKTIKDWRFFSSMSKCDFNSHKEQDLLRRAYEFLLEHYPEKILPFILSDLNSIRSYSNSRRGDKLKQILERTVPEFMFGGNGNSEFDYFE